jgi:hypothetical protein
MRKPFLSYFCTIKDHRINRKKRHPLENIIAITIIAIICGAETREEAACYGEVRKKFFSKFLDFKNGIHGKDTFRRFFAALDPQVLEGHFLRWKRSLVKDIDKEFASIDGKTIRGASRTREDHPIHLASAWASMENKTHWCLDTVFGEDGSGKREGFSAQNFSLIILSY